MRNYEKKKYKDHYKQVKSHMSVKNWKGKAAQTVEIL